MRTEQRGKTAVKKSAVCILACFMILGTAACGQNKETTDRATDAALTPRPLPVNAAVANPYMAGQDAAVHNDSFSSDVTASPAPLGIDCEVNITLDNESTNSTPCAFYDNMGNAVAPYRGGIAIKNLYSEKVQVLGSFVPQRDDGASYNIQSSYSFVDEKNRVVVPT